MSWVWVWAKLYPSSSSPPHLPTELSVAFQAANEGTKCCQLFCERIRSSPFLPPSFSPSPLRTGSSRKRDSITLSPRSR